MALTWESQSSTDEGITIKRFYLYIINQQFTLGGTAGLQEMAPAVGFDVDSALALYPFARPQYLHGDEPAANQWNRVVFFEESAGVFIEVLVQSFINNDLSGTKRQLFPVNSGPDELAALSDDWFLMNNPSFVGPTVQFWGAITAGAHNQFGFMPNTVPEPQSGSYDPGGGPVVVFRPEITTPTNQYDNTANFFFSPASLGFVLGPAYGAGGDLMNPGQPINRFGTFYSSVFSGGPDWTLYTRDVRLTVDPDPGTVTCDVDIIGGIGKNIVTAAAMSLIHSEVQGGNTVRIYRASFAPNLASGENMRDYGTAYDIDINRDDSSGFLTTPITPIYNPWQSFQAPPPYQVTGQDNSMVIGGYQP